MWAAGPLPGRGTLRPTCHSGDTQEVITGRTSCHFWECADLNPNHKFWANRSKNPNDPNRTWAAVSWLTASSLVRPNTAGMNQSLWAISHLTYIHLSETNQRPCFWWLQRCCHRHLCSSVDALTWRSSQTVNILHISVSYTRRIQRVALQTHELWSQNLLLAFGLNRNTLWASPGWNRIAALGWWREAQWL